MSLIKSSLVLIGFVVYLLNALPAATAASFDKYLVAPPGTVSAPGAFTPFLVKVSDSNNALYLNLYYRNDPNLPIVGLSPNAGVSFDEYSFSATLVGGFSSDPPSSNINQTISWEPYVVPPNTTHLSVAVLLNVVLSYDEHGNPNLGTGYSNYCITAPCTPTQMVFTASRSQPQRMTTLNGNQIEVVPVKIRLDGAPWATYYFGYGVGLVASEVFSIQLYAPSFSPVTLPPPKADGTVVEYVNTLDFPNAPGGHYFYASDPAEQTTIDAGGVGKFVRTGRSFASGGGRAGVPLLRQHVAGAKFTLLYGIGK